jgi:hypothetical protein
MALDSSVVHEVMERSEEAEKYLNERSMEESSHAINMLNSCEKEGLLLGE